MCVDGVRVARIEEGRPASRLYQWFRQEKMVACTGWRGELKFRVKQTDGPHTATL